MKHPRIMNGAGVILGLSLGLLGAMPVQAQGPTDAKPVPYENRPYAIRVLFDFEPEARVDPARLATLADQWLDMVERFVGRPWVVQFAENLGNIPAIPLDQLKADDLKPFAAKMDKVWVIRFSREGSNLILAGCELDVLTGDLGEVHRRAVPFPIDLARELFELAREMFTPSAEVGDSKAGGVMFLVQGGAIPPSSPLGAVVSVGTVFRVVRIFPKKEGESSEIVPVKYSYFRVERLEGPRVRCEIITGVRDPLSTRYARANTMVALGIKPAPSPTRLRFITKGDNQPAAGYRLIARTIPVGATATDVGMTDREGRIVLPAGFASSLVSLRLMAGNDEPMLDMPVMPGETPDERLVVFEPRPLTLALEARLDALRDAIIDVVADRSRLEARMKARLDGEDWQGLDDTIKEFRKLTPKSDFESRLTKIREEGERQEAEAKTLVLTKNARASLDDTKGLIDRYMDDDAIRSFEDAAQRAKAELAKPKAPAKGTKKAG